MLVACVQELYKRDRRADCAVRTEPSTLTRGGKTKSAKEKNIRWFNYLKIPHPISHTRGSGRVLVSRTPQTFFAGCVNMITCSGCPKRNPSHNLHFIPHPRWLIGLLSFVESGATAVGVASIAIVLVRCGKKRRLYSGAAPQNLMWVRPAVCCSGSPCWISPASWPLGASSACYASWSPPRWRRWACPCRLSGSPTGSRSSDWTTPRPGTLCSCSAAAGCRGEESEEKKIEFKSNIKLINKGQMFSKNKHCL